MAEPLTLTVQGTPNPNAVKFTLNRTVAVQGRSYRDAATADVTWVQELLRIGGIQQVFVLNNFVSVTKSSDAGWDHLGPQAEQILRRAFS